MRSTPVVLAAGLWALAVLGAAEGTRVQAFLAAKSDAERKAVLEGLGDPQLAALQDDIAAQARQLLPAARLDEAAHAWELFAELAESRQDRPGIVRSVAEIGYVRAHQGRLAEADELFDKAVHMATDWGDATGLAWARTEKAFVCMWRGDFANARDLVLAALPVLEAGPDKNRAAAALTAAANAMSRLGDYKRALAFHRRSLELFKETGDARGPARALYGMAIVYQRNGDFARALDYQRQALAVSEANDDQMGICGSLTQMGSIFRQQGDYAQALEHTQKALRVAERTNLQAAVMNVSSHLGETYEGLGDRVHALEAFERSLGLARQIGSKTHESQVLNDLGDMALDQGEVAHAVELQHSSLTIAHDIGDPSLEAAVLVSLAEALLGAGQSAEAATAAANAAGVSKDVVPDMYWQARWMAARIDRARGDTASARLALDEAIRTIEELRSHAAGDEDERGKFFEHVIAPYYDAIDLAEAAGDRGAALSYAERAKARVLLECLKNGRPDIDDSLTPEERATRESLQASLRSLNRRVQATTSAEPNPALRAEREKARQEYGAFETRLYAARPELRLQEGDLAVLSPAEIAELLAEPDAAVVEFVVLDKRVLTFTITRGASAASPDIRVDSRDITRDELRKRVRRFADALGERRLDFAADARGLYDLLLKPIAGGIGKRGRLTIIPDDVLWQLPFQALKPDADGYVVERHAVSYAPSLSALREMSRRKPGHGASRTLLGVGDPAGASGSAPARLQALYRDARLGALPEAAREVRTLGRIYGPENSTLFTGAAAQEAVIKREMPRYDVVHLATHGIFDDTSPLYSQIVLAPTKDGNEDGLLEAWEMMQMKLSADLVVLSACQTARGRVGRGEGVIGMSWALLVAGCPTTVVSQWNVESRSTADLMLAFHRALAQRPRAGHARHSKAEALREAELEILRQPAYAHPFYWAAFSVVGAAS
jgi:CHAT domain-containing protein/tetratricopeptide (TPR) repeat protein